MERDKGGTHPWQHRAGGPQLYPTNAQPHHCLLPACKVQLQLHTLLQPRLHDPLQHPMGRRPALWVLPGLLPTAIETQGGQVRDAKMFCPVLGLPVAHRCPARGIHPPGHFAGSTSLGALLQHSRSPGPANKEHVCVAWGLTCTRAHCSPLSPPAPRSPRTVFILPTPAPSDLLLLQRGALAVWPCHGQCHRDPATASVLME